MSLIGFWSTSLSPLRRFVTMDDEPA